MCYSRDIKETDSGALSSRFVSSNIKYRNLEQHCAGKLCSKLQQLVNATFKKLKTCLWWPLLIAFILQIISRGQETQWWANQRVFYKSKIVNKERLPSRQVYTIYEKKVICASL